MRSFEVFLRLASAKFSPMFFLDMLSEFSLVFKFGITNRTRDGCIFFLFVLIVTIATFQDYFFILINQFSNMNHSPKSSSNRTKCFLLLEGALYDLDR